jgi:hypothetical protein
VSAGGNTQAKGTAKRKEAFLEVLERNAGSITDACKAIGTARHQYYDWIKKDEKFKEQCDAITESLIDRAESKLHAAIEGGQAWAICFFLKCKAKHRGYVERQEVTGADGGPIHHALDEIPEEALRAIAGRSRSRTGATAAD